MAEGEDSVTITFKGGVDSGQPPNPPAAPPTAPDPDDNFDKANEALTDAASHLRDSASHIDETLEQLRTSARDEGVEAAVPEWLTLSQTIDALVRKAEEDRGPSLDEIQASIDALDRQEPSRETVDLSAFTDDLGEHFDSLARAIESLANQSKEPVPKVSPKKDESLTFLERLNKYITRPAAQASFTPTLFRNNLERTVLTSLTKVSSAGPQIQSTLTSLVGKAGLSKAATSAATGLGVLAGVAVAVPATLLGLATAAVATSQALDAANQKIANTIIDFSPEVAIAQAQRDLRDIYNRRERAALIGPDVASAMIEFQDISDEMSRLLTNIYDWLDNSLTRWGLDQVEGVLQVFNGLLEYFSNIDTSLASINRIYSRDKQEKFAEAAESTGLGQFARRLAAQSGDAKSRIIVEEIERQAREAANREYYTPPEDPDAYRTYM